VRVIDVATSLFPDAEVEVVKCDRRRGLSLWRWIFGASIGGMGMELKLWGIDINYEAKVYFPVETEDVNVLEIEEELLLYAGDKKELLVADVGAILHWEPNGKTYRMVKKGLEERGWVWKSVKRKGIVSKVICVPKR
jgi:hypothetical protein